MRGLILRPRSCLWLALTLLAASPAAQALDPRVSLHDYQHDTWRRKDGAPGSITSLAQSSDGWLWIGTDHGLYRFDGLSFQRFQSPTGQRLLSARISTLTGKANGDLLVGYLDGGVNLIRHGDIVPLPAWNAARVDMVFDIAADQDEVWICTNSGLVRYAKGSWQQIGDGWGLPKRTVEEATLDQYGQLWVVSGDEWFKLDRAARRFRPTGRAGEAGAFFAPDGGMWRRSGNRIERVPSGYQGAPLPRLETNRHLFRQTHDLFDADGNLWLLRAPNGIARIRKQDLPASASFDPSTLPAERLDQAWQLSNPQIIGMLEDREGNIWAMSTSGLERFRNRRIRTVALPDGADIASVAADGQGQVWAGAANLDGLWAIG
ncbi:ligand-binding sensor domain-containing protein, partial [Duganella callida]